MATAPTYPGVYLQEIPSGVRTIVGVSTSLAAFVGTAKRGPVNKAVRIFGYADFERRYGGLAQTSEMSYAVRQFFRNGGAEAFIIRVARDPLASSEVLTDAAGADVLRVEARDKGKAGDDIDVRVDYRTAVPDSTFNLTVTYRSPDNTADVATETFQNLSMNSFDPRYAVGVVEEGSRLVSVTRVADLTALAAASGTSTSGPIEPDPADFGTLLDDTHSTIYLVVDGGAPVAIRLQPPNGNFADIADLADVEQAITDGIAAIPASLRPAVTASTTGNQLVLTSDTPGEKSSVRVLSGPNDAAARLALGSVNGGSEADAAATIRPASSTHGTVTSGTLGDLTALPAADKNSFRISVDGLPPLTATLAPGTVADGEEMAEKIQTAVRALRAGFKDFTCEFDVDKLVLTSGLAGAGSAVKIEAAATNDIAASLKLLPADGAVSAPGANTPLVGGQELDFTPEQAFAVYIGNRSAREGIYALEAEMIFNILCLPGVSDTSILTDADAYCVERRAFLIVDPDKGQKPDEMLLTATGTALPKSDHAAVYYPWVRIADPLQGGKLRTCPPSGTMAGLYARTDGSRGVWKAPAGTEASLIGVEELEYALSDPENGTLNPLGVNCLRIFPVFGAVSWGARTLRGADQMAWEYKYISIRRLALNIEQSLYYGTQWAVFEPNDEPLWAQLRLAIGAFMQNLFRQGAFQGKTPSEAYFVKVDKETTTQNDINLGIVNIVVGFAPLKPAEFVIIKLQQIAGQIAV